ncbi:MAG: 4Fe-4S binding protein [Candidatus Schekmanbacteria bacterium]|nr:4Fe-4S binding protein [Candidatus Schekmanbacteria bacterium]
MTSIEQLEKIQQEKQALWSSGIKLVPVCGVCIGGQKLAQAMRDEVTRQNIADKVQIVETGCQGFCKMGPLVNILPPEGISQWQNGTLYTKVKVEDAAEIISKSVMGPEVIERLLYKNAKTNQRIPVIKDIPFYSKQSKYVLERCGVINPDDITDYIAWGGYQAAHKIIKTMTPETVIGEVTQSGIRGRGGAGFPTGIKWKFCRQSPGPDKFMICNADEGDPGAFMDRAVLEGDPHSVLEGMIIGAYAIGANYGYVYVRAEYPLAVKRVRQAIKQAKEYGLLGNNIFGSDFSFDIGIKMGAGAFVCGEETALISSIEDRRGMPRPRPPFPVAVGLRGKPTCINNVETLANLANIINKGAKWYTGIGTEKNYGTKVFSLAGAVRNVGLVEVPLGATLQELIFDIGGGAEKGRKFKAVQLGGPSGGCLPEKLLDIKIGYDSLIQAGAIMGSGGVIVIDNKSCMVEVARYFTSFCQKESCGKCTPCRIGLMRMKELLERITSGEGQKGDIELLIELANSIKDTSLCGLGQTAPNPVLSTIRQFRHEYEAHIREKECPAHYCKPLVKFMVDTDKCKACGQCIPACPVEAVKGKKGEKVTIDVTLCTKCRSCIEACPFDAIV